MISSRLSSFLTNSTALVGVGSLVILIAVSPINPAFSDTINGTVGPQILKNGDSLTISSTGVVQHPDYPMTTRYTGGPVGFGVDVQGTDIKGIDNNGQIIAGWAINLGRDDRISGSISNSNLISADFTGIILQGSTVTGGIYNSGTIKAGNFQSGQAINIRNGSTVGDIINTSDGIITVTGGAANIFIENSTVNSLTNHGSIVGGAGAISLANAVIPGGVSNTGLISGNRGIWITRGDLPGGITNTGVINGDSSDGLGLSSVTLDGAINNKASGIIRATGISYVETEYENVADEHGHFEEDPGPSIYDGNGSAISLNYVTMSKGINNAGLVEGQVAGIIAEKTTINGAINNSGTIVGKKGIQFSDGALAGGLINTGTIEGTEGTAIQLSDLNANSTITLNGGRIIGNIIDQNNETNFSHIVIGGDFKLEGNITASDLIVNSGKTLTVSARNSISIVRMPKSSGTLNFGVKSSDRFGRIEVTGVGNGINLEGLKVIITASNLNLGAGDELSIGQGNAQVIGLDGGNGQQATSLEDNLLLLNFVLADGSQSDVTESDNNQDLYLVVTEGESLEELADSTEDKQVADILTDLANSDDDAIKLIWESLNNAESEEEINNILNNLLAGASSSGAAAATFVSNTNFNITSDRLVAIRSNGQGNTGISSGDVSKGLQVWMQGFGELADQGERGGVSGFDLSSVGLTGGIDSENIINDAVLGLSFGYSFTNIDSNGAGDASSDIKSYQVTVYGDYDLDQNTYLNAMAGYAYHDNEGSRVPLAGLVAKSDYAAHQYIARMELGRSYQLGSTFLIPNVMGQLAHYNPDSYTETGAGGANLSVDIDSTNIAELGVGVDAKWLFKPDIGGIIETQLGAQYRYDFIGEAVSTTTAFTGGGSAIDSEGFDPAQSTVVLGAGLRYQLNDSWEVSAQYDFEYKTDYRAHTGAIRAAYNF